MFFGERAGGFGLAQLFVVRSEGGQVGQGLLVVVAFLTAGLFQAVPKDFGIVVRGCEERVELERVLAMRTRTEQPRISKGGGGQIEARQCSLLSPFLDGSDDGGRRGELFTTHGGPARFGGHR